MSLKIKVDLLEDLDNELIMEIIGEHYAKDVLRYNYLYDLYKGIHPILDRVVGENKPNNRLVGDFYGKLIDTEIGYFLGKPIVFNSEDKNALDELGNILVENEFDELIMEVGKEGSIKGKSYIFVYQNEESETKMCRLSPENVITLESNRGSGEIGIALRIYKEYTKNDEEIIYIEAYDKFKIKCLKIKGGDISIDDRVYPNGECGHIFGQVPIFCYKNNEEEMGSFEKVITLVEAYDKLISDTSNEHEAYRNAYLVLKNMSVDTEAQLRLKESGILELFDDGEAFFLSKPIMDNAINSHLDRLNCDIHKFADIPDMSDEAFAGNLSGVAIRFKLLGLENKCIIKERKLAKAIRRVLKALNRVIVVKCDEEIDISRLQIIFNRNVPNNLQEIVDSVVKLDGIVDKETLLSLLPFVESPTEILEKLNDEQGSYEKDMAKYKDSIFKGVSNVGDDLGESVDSEEVVNPLE